MNKRTIIGMLIILMLIISGVIGLTMLLQMEEAANAPITADTMSVSDEILEAELFSGMVQIGDSLLTVPCTVEELLACDVTLTDTTYSTAYLLSVDEVLEVPVSYSDMSFSVTIENNTENTERLVFCQVTAINNITSSTILLPGGIGVGIQGFEMLQDAWGIADDTTSESTTSLTTVYYREGVTMKDIYAWDDGGSNVSSATSVVDVNGTGYYVTIDRLTGYITGLSVTFQDKAGLLAVEDRTTYFAMGEVTISYLTDSISVDSGDLYYCVQEIDGAEYVIGMGVTGATFDELGTLLDRDDTTLVYMEQVTIVDGEEVVEVITVEEEGTGDYLYSSAEKYLVYDSYDFSDNYTLVQDESNWKSYYGEYYNDSIYFALSAEVQAKSACGIAFYIHPLDRDGVVTDAALDYMRNLVKVTRESLSFS